MRKIDRTYLTDRISKDELQEYYKNHTRRELEKHFNINPVEASVLFKFYRIFNTKRESKRSDIESLSRKQFIQEILECKTYSALAKKFNVSTQYVLKIKRRYKLQGKQIGELLAEIYDRDFVVNYYNNHTLRDTSKYFHTNSTQIRILFKLLNISERDKDANYQWRQKTFISNYGKEENKAGYDMKLAQYKSTMLKRFGAENPSKVPELKKKAIKSLQLYKDNNKMHQSSKLEKNLLMELCKAFGDSNVKYQHYDKKLYPFNCDFYIVDMDMWIELNAWWHHGEKPYQGSLSDLKILDEIKALYPKQYDSLEKVWTRSDPKKFDYAKKNNLNYIAIYNDGSMYDKDKNYIYKLHNAHDITAICSYIKNLRKEIRN